MPKNTIKQLPKFDTLEQLVDGDVYIAFDSNDVGDYLASMPEVHFDAAITRHTHLVALDQDLTQQVNAIAKAKRTTSSKLINKWVREHVVAQTK